MMRSMGMFDTLDYRILKRLHQSETPVAAADLCGELSCSLQELHTRYEELTRAGLNIENKPGEGFLLKDDYDLLVPEDIAARLQGIRFGKKILIFDETTSTQDTALKLAREGLPEGTVIIAGFQTKGRGRYKRAWVAPKHSSLLFSFLVTPGWSRLQVARATAFVAVGIVRALREWGFPATIKYPNDILIGGRKVCGILTESLVTQSVLYYVVGIGINVNVTEFPPELEDSATSLLREFNRRASPPELMQPLLRPALMACLLSHLDRAYDQCLQRFDLIRDEWAEYCDTLGQTIAIKGSHPTQGLALGLDDDGFMLLRTASGQIEKLCGGEIEKVA
ncbi:MAG: biotin--[acetyl-CoA-carboxylase] ligase [Verrucomicrobiota bacterium]|nr:biotin--[acetyl-CoA-carboxylase] ligase [Verrucomicrobiota bacterium]